MSAPTIDHYRRYPRRLELARTLDAEVIDFEQTSVLEALMEMTGGIGPDAVIDAVGMESHGFAIDNLFDTVKQKVGFGADRGHALREAIMACRKGGASRCRGSMAAFSTSSRSAR